MSIRRRRKTRSRKYSANLGKMRIRSEVLGLLYYRACKVLGPFLGELSLAREAVAPQSEASRLLPATLQTSQSADGTTIDMPGISQPQEIMARDGGSDRSLRHRWSSSPRNADSNQLRPVMISGSAPRRRRIAQPYQRGAVDRRERMPIEADIDDGAPNGDDEPKTIVATPSNSRPLATGRCSGGRGRAGCFARLRHGGRAATAGPQPVGPRSQSQNGGASDMQLNIRAAGRPRSWRRCRLACNLRERRRHGADNAAMDNVQVVTAREKRRIVIR